MSIVDVKSLTTRAMESILSLNPFSDSAAGLSQTNVSSCTPGKENEPLDIEEFGVSPKYSHRHDSGTADSPSRRKKLMGSLRRISSMRSVKSPPTKDKGKQRAPSPYPHSPEQVERPGTSVRDTERRLVSECQQSPSDGPVIDSPSCERFDSFAPVHQSSPILIPPLVKQDAFTCNIPSTPLELPPGTVPGSPAPLQKALEKDPDQFVLSVESSPVHPHTGVVAEPLLTPMPGTNVGFDDTDIVRSSSLSVRDTVGLVERADYFDISSKDDCEIVARTILENIACDEPAGPKASISQLSGREQASSAKIDGSLWVSRHPSAAAKPSSHDAMSNGYSNYTNDDLIADDDSVSLYGALEGRQSALGVRADVDPRLPPPPSPEHDLVQLRNQTRLRTRASPQVASGSRPSLSDVVDTAPTQSTWGTHGSLYDGTGYGDDSSSSSSSPRLSLTIRSIRERTDTTSNSVYTTETNAPTAEELRGHENSSPATNPHKVLDDAICAYAVQEEGDASADIDIISGDDTNNVFARPSTSVE